MDQPCNLYIIRHKYIVKGGESLNKPILYNNFKLDSYYRVVFE